MNSHQKAQEAQNRSARSWIGVLILVLLIPASSCAQADETSRSWNQPVKPFRIAGNLYYVGASDVTSYLIVTPQAHPGIVADYERTFQILKSLPCDIFLGAHGNFFDLTGKLKLLEQGTKQNPFVDPQGYKRYIEDTEKTFQKELERQRK